MVSETFVEDDDTDTFTACSVGGSNDTLQARSQHYTCAEKIHLCCKKVESVELLYTR